MPNRTWDLGNCFSPLNDCRDAYDTICLPFHFFFLGLLLHQWTGLEIHKEKLSVPKLSLIGIMIFFSATILGKFMNIIERSVPVSNPIYHFFMCLISSDVVMTALFSTVCLCLLDWIEIITILDFSTNYHPEKYKILFIGIVIICFVLGALEAADTLPVFGYISLGYSMILSFFLGISFFITSRSLMSKLPSIGQQTWICSLRWSVLLFGLLFSAVQVIHFVFLFMEDLDFEFFSLILCEVLMTVLNVICMFSMTSRIKEERTLLEELTLLKKDFGYGSLSCQ